MPTISHYVGYDIAVKGSGNLRSKLISKDDLRTETLVPLAMSAAPGRQFTRLANTVEEKVYLEIWTEDIDEIFHITEITLFIKPRATMYPG